ncbi:AAA family ATPase [Limosilactobacillus oris]|uniref:AAA family ATPase n=1 Tax=Limosilactobacillus oris TaxID=1632 RepID=UPI00345C5BD2
MWGPPGSGKTTLAYVMSQTLQLPFENLTRRFRIRASCKSSLTPTRMRASSSCSMKFTG